MQVGYGSMSVIAVVCRDVTWEILGDNMGDNILNRGNQEEIGSSWLWDGVYVYMYMELMYDYMLSLWLLVVMIIYGDMGDGSHNNTCDAMMLGRPADAEVYMYDNVCRE